MEKRFLQVGSALEPFHVLTKFHIYQTPYPSPQCLRGHTNLDEDEHDSRGGAKRDID